MCDIVDVPAEVSESSEKMEREGVPLKEEGVIWSLPEAGVALNDEGVMCSPPGAAGGKDEGEMVDKVEGVLVRLNHTYGSGAGLNHPPAVHEA